MTSNERTPLLQNGDRVSSMPDHLDRTFGSQAELNSFTGTSATSQRAPTPQRRREIGDQITVRRAIVPSRSSVSLNVQDNEILSEPDLGASTITAPSSGPPSPTFVSSGGLHRYRFYSRLAPGADTFFLMPEHVVPPEFFFTILVPFKKPGGKQSSIITIFAIWNTMLGTSILSIPWGINQAGFATSIMIMCAMAAVSLYTAYIVVRSVNYPGIGGSVSEFSDVCQHFLGWPGKWLAIVFSLVAFLGAMLVYYVLLTNFMFNSVDFVHTKFFIAANGNATEYSLSIYNETITDAICDHMPLFTYDAVSQPHFDWLQQDDVTSAFHNATHINITSPSVYQRLWNQQKTVPFWLLIPILPLVSIKSPTFFTKFNALGTLSIVYLIGFVITKAFRWGIHMNFTSLDPHFYIPEFKPNFLSLSGICALAFFLHNAIIALLSNQKNPQNNARDLFIAYLLVTGTYLGVGFLYYITFPLAKICIKDNFLDNIISNDILVFVGRVALFFQMITVFPLLMFIFRAQIMQAIFNTPYPSAVTVTFVHVLVLSLCVIFAVFVPKIGLIIRFSGALCGFVYIFTLPILVHLRAMKISNQLSWYSLVFHSFLLIVGFLNFAGQFLVYLI